MIHELKTWPHFFSAIASGDKNFEVRKNDRNFQLGDELLLREFKPENYDDEVPGEHYTGRILHRQIRYILQGGEFGINEGYVVLGLAKL